MEAFSNIPNAVSGPPTVGPPQSPEHQQQRVTAWKRFLQRVANDPGFAEGLLAAGSSLLTPGPGGFGGAFGRAATAFKGAKEETINTQLQRQNLAARTDAARASSEAARAGAEASRASAAKTQQDIEFNAEDRPIERRGKEAQTSLLEEQASQLRASRELELERLRSTIDQLKASAEQLRAAGQVAGKQPEELLADRLIQSFMREGSLKAAPEGMGKVPFIQLAARLLDPVDPVQVRILAERTLPMPDNLLDPEEYQRALEVRNQQIDDIVSLAQTPPKIPESVVSPEDRQRAADTEYQRLSQELIATTPTPLLRQKLKELADMFEQDPRYGVRPTNAP